MTTEQQAPPYCIQIELNEGCNLRCPYCGLNGIREEGKLNFKRMTPERAWMLANDLHTLGWNCRLEFAMHGEPTMNPAIVEIFWTFRKALPRNYMLLVTNGGGIYAKKDKVASLLELFNAGVTTVAIDEYQNIPFAAAIWADVGKRWDEFTLNSTGTIDIMEYPKCGPGGNPHLRQPVSRRRLIRVAPIDVSTDGTHATLNNHAGAGAPLNDNAEGKRCAKPFREISVRWDGNVAVCCNDWRGVYKCGNVYDDGIATVWNNAYFRAARRKLVLGQRDFGPCKGCDATSYRPGLLPDHLGKETLPKPTKDDAKIIAEACSGDSYTAAVLRPWEKAATNE